MDSLSTEFAVPLCELSLPEIFHSFSGDVTAPNSVVHGACRVFVSILAALLEACLQAKSYKKGNSLHVFLFFQGQIPLQNQVAFFHSLVFSVFKKIFCLMLMVIIYGLFGPV